MKRPNRQKDKLRTRKTFLRLQERIKERERENPNPELVTLRGKLN